MLVFSLLSYTYLAATVLAASYSQSDSYQGEEFLSGFTHWDTADPTHGRVNYLGKNDALAQNLTFASGDTLVIRTDDKTVLDPSGPGRNSVRLYSNKKYKNHVTVWNIRHMPEGCGTWPAVWESGENWPEEGEIDILEGVNDKGLNRASLHTTSGCTMPPLRTMTGTSVGDNCDVVATGNGGCGVSSNDAKSYGPAFNKAGGGFYAMERSDAGVKIWFWRRSSCKIPSEVLSGANQIDTDKWGTPFAAFPSDSCDMNSHFGPHSIIINLTLCGDWGAAAFNSDGCTGDCVTFVNQNPAAFSNAYFDVAWLKVYE